VAVAIVVPSLKHRKDMLVDNLIDQTLLVLSERIKSASVTGQFNFILPNEVSKLAVFDQTMNARLSNSPSLEFSDFDQYIKKTGQIESGEVLVARMIRAESDSFYIIARLSAYHIYKELIDYAQNIAALVFLVMLVLMASSWYITQRIVIHPLRKVIDAIESNDLREKLEWNRKDEFGELVDSYNSMLEGKEAAERRVKMKQNQLGVCRT